MRKIKAISFLLFFGQSISITIAQNNYNNFENELQMDLVTLKECNSSCDGFVKIVPLTGTSPFLYSIDGGGSFSESDEYNGLCAQKYFVHIRDKNGKLGLGLIDLTHPLETEQLEPLDQANQIADLNTQLLSHQKSSLEYRKIQWRLYRMNVPQVATLTLQSSTNGKNTYSIPVIFPDESMSSNYDEIVQRVLTEVDEVGIEMDYNTWIMTIVVSENENLEPSLLKALSFLGYSSIEFKLD